MEISLIIKKGSFGANVRKLQTLLNAAGIKCDIDGQFGDATLKAVKKFQAAHFLMIDGIVGNLTWAALNGTTIMMPPIPMLMIDGVPVDINDEHPLPASDYYQSGYAKTQIVLHHTAGAPSAIGSITGWAMAANHVATAFVINGNEGRKGGAADGTIYRAFPEQQYDWHLGTQDQSLNVISIGIEICSWGFLKQGADGRFYSYVGTVVPDAEVITLEKAWRGCKYFQRYSEAQIEATRRLLLALSAKYGIPLATRDYRAVDAFDLRPQDALAGKPGVYFHCNYRPDKTDIFPQPEMIEMLAGLS